ncbi:glycine zipper 2TM domain-containing protein [Paludibacterium paludis]|uniref:Lipoprotein n=1 Tax=Paludibacterium paludis TaxID=1225769 RepID=A0A918UBH2_9NEIS|nr:glycine zipper 2TM domain-containing protein [Paludibacterium paludis]GGY22956.1 lipoprotein [Paludibacterium paludis]
MIKYSGKSVIAALLAVGVLAGCASPDSAMVYSGRQTQRAQTVQIGTVVSVQAVKVEGNRNELLTLGGAAVGGIAGSSIGKGKGSAVGAIVGAIAGGVAADAAQKSIGGKQSVEVTVKLDRTGEMLSIVQAPDVPIAVGQRVRVMRGGGTDRIMPY